VIAQCFKQGHARLYRDLANGPVDIQFNSHGFGTKLFRYTIARNRRRLCRTCGARRWLSDGANSGNDGSRSCAFDKRAAAKL
jgi:hypothetical protein